MIEHTRDAMWQTDGLVHVLAAGASLVGAQSKLAEDLEIWASSEFDYVEIADGYSRSSVLMPQKRNPYALSIVRGANGTLIGRLTGFLAVVKSPSARSDNLIYAYGEVPRALDLHCARRGSDGVRPHAQGQPGAAWGRARDGFSQATDLAEYVMQTCAVDYRTAYQVVGIAVRDANAAGLRGIDITAPELDAAARSTSDGRWAGRRRPDRSAGPAHDRRDQDRCRAGPLPRSWMAWRRRASARRSSWRRRRSRASPTFDEVDRRLDQRADDIRASRSGGFGMREVRLPDSVSVINVGLPLFADAVRQQGRPAVQVDWRIPAEGDPTTIAALRRLSGPLCDRIDEANAEVLRRLDSGVPVATGVRAAREVVEGIDERTLLHAGPSVHLEEACDPLRRSMRAAVVAEGWADDVEAADALLASGEVTLSPANDHLVVVPMATVMGPAPRSGSSSSPTATRVRSARAGLGRGVLVRSRHPGRDRAARVPAGGGGTRPRRRRRRQRPDRRDVPRRAGGDDGRRRPRPHPGRDEPPHPPPAAALVSGEHPRRVEVARFLSANYLLFLTLAMASARALTSWAAEVEGSSVVTTMARNGTEFGVRMDRYVEWFRAPAPMVGHALYHPGKGPEDSAPDIGDSSVLELVGLGGAAAAGSPAVGQLVGGLPPRGS